MKKFLATALCVLPLALVPTAYAQSSAGGQSGAAPSQTSPTPGQSGSAATPGGSTASPGTGTGGTAAPGAGGGGATAPGAGGGGATAPAPGTGAGMNAPSSDKASKTVSGWSVKDKIIGTAVYNEKKEKVGDIDDVILAPDGKAVYFVVGAGGFIGMGQHDVAIPFEKITKNGDKMVLEGYTKEQLKAMPEVKVSGQ